MRRSVVCGLILPLLMLLLFSGCLASDREKIITIEDATATRLDEIHSFEVRFGDGKLLTISDPVAVQAIAAKLKELRLQYVADVPEGVGYQYALHFGNPPINIYYNMLYVNGKQYKSMNGVPQEVDALILVEGRKKYPGLLPGIASP